MFRLILIAYFWCLCVGVSAQNQQLVPVQDLKKDWLTVSRDGQGYVPYVAGTSLSYPVVGILVNTSSEAGLVLECCVQQGTSIFINNKIVDRTDNSLCRYFNIDSLAQAYTEDDLFVSFFSDQLNPSLLTTTLLASQKVLVGNVAEDNSAQVKKRPANDFANFFMLAVLFIAAFYAFLINQYPRAYRDFFNFSKAFSPTLKEEKILSQRTMTTANALFMWGHSMVISLIVVLFWKNLGGIPDLFKFVSLQSLNSAIVSWLFLALLVYLTIGLKYLLIRILCSLLNFEKIAQIHFFDFIRLSMIFASFTLITLAVIFFIQFDQPLNLFKIILYAFIAFLVARMSIVLLKLIAGSTFRKVHLISYLCTTEILPLLIGIRIFF